MEGKDGAGSRVEGNRVGKGSEKRGGWKRKELGGKAEGEGSGRKWRGKLENSDG